jgi:hypothetical protein
MLHNTRLGRLLLLPSYADEEYVFETTVANEGNVKLQGINIQVPGATALSDVQPFELAGKNSRKSSDTFWFKYRLTLGDLEVEKKTFEATVSGATWFARYPPGQQVVNVGGSVAARTYPLPSTASFIVVQEALPMAYAEKP